MRYFSVTLMFSLLLLISCSKENPVTPPETGKTGGLQFSVDKVNAPSNVVTVKAILSREGFDSLTGSLNIKSDSTADISFKSIPIGKWHIKIEALDAQDQIIYEGESDVEILESTLVHVKIELLPVGDGTGDVYIQVTWGKTSRWQDFGLNPVLSPSMSEYDFKGVIQSQIIEDNGKYIMYYGGLVNNARTYILRAESVDGINWTKTGSYPVISPGSGWDAQAVHPGPIIKENGQFRMYYSGFSDVNGKWSVGLATSTDGINWTKNPFPVIEGTYGWESQLLPWSIIKKDNKYYMYYSGRGEYPVVKIGIAISSDGMKWEKYQGNPVLVPTHSWENGALYLPTVIYDNGQYNLTYSDLSNKFFGWATSTDGLEWSKSSEPFFKIEDIANRWADEMAYPFFIKINGELRCYYTGTNFYQNGDHVDRIGFVAKK